MKDKCRLFVIICIAFFIALQRIYDYQNGGFRSSKLISNQPPLLNRATEEIDALLNQPFRFLGFGGTSFVFLGEDKKTVLKLFKQQHLQQKHLFWHIALPGVLDTLRFSKILKDQKKQAHKHQSFFFNSCRLGTKELKEATGLIYLCLQPNPHFAKPIRLTDAWGIPHVIDLRKTEFALQHNAELFFPYLEKLMREKNRAGLQSAIDALLTHIKKRCSKGIGDRDPNLSINFGFVGTKVVEFDLGSYFLKPTLKNPLETAQELFFSTYALQKWLEKHSPDLLDYLLEQIAQRDT
jgi:hypothetical protein